MANFEVFTRRNPPSSPGPTLTLTKRGVLTLNTAAYEAIGRPDSVQLLWDRDNRIVGVRPAAGADTYNINKTNLMINAAAFTRWVGFKSTHDMPNALRWDAYVEDDVLCMRLTDKPRPVTSNRARP